MCGIAGYLATKDYWDEDVITDVEAMALSMQRRGPDAHGLWFSAENGIVLGHRRLAIIDLSYDANQPMLNLDESLSIVFNGEIYNYRELRADLKKSHRIKFKTNSDTEVILALYSMFGMSFAKKLRGMFSIAIWDKSKSKLILSRDGYGIKPLYYYFDGNRIVFASQVKALLKCKKISLSPSAGGVVSFLCNGYVEEPFTLYNEIKALPAGYTATFLVRYNKLTFDIEPHTCLKSIWQQASKVSVRHKDAIDAIEEALFDSVKYHMVSDVPVGLFLSSGIDSVSMLGLMSKPELNLNAIKSLCLGFSSYRGTSNDETLLAAEVADYFNADHYTELIKGNDLTHFYDDIFDAMDQPSIDGINTWLVSKVASDLGLKVAVSGLGGDELFGGYPSFSQLGRMLKYTSLGSRYQKITELYELFFDKFTLLSDHFHPKAKYVFREGKTIQGLYNLKRSVFLASELTQYLDNDFVEQGRLEIQQTNTSNVLDSIIEGEGANFMQVSYLESTRYMRNQLLRDSDWASMYHSLEVRTPLVDTQLLQKVAPYLLANRETNKKSMLLQSSGLDRGLQNKILNRPKSGFTTPMSVPSGKVKLDHVSWDKQWSREVLSKFNVT